LLRCECRAATPGIYETLANSEMADSCWYAAGIGDLELVVSLPEYREMRPTPTGTAHDHGG